MQNIKPTSDQALEHALYPVMEVKQLYKIKAQYETLLMQLNVLQQENAALKKQLSQQQS